MGIVWFAAKEMEEKRLAEQQAIQNQTKEQARIQREEMRKVGGEVWGGILLMGMRVIWHMLYLRGLNLLGRGIGIM